MDFTESGRRAVRLTGQPLTHLARKSAVDSGRRIPLAGDQVTPML